MENYDVYRDNSERTGGDIYIGVVGPVRTGKSTFITKVMDQLVMPSIQDAHEKERVTDELPQSGSGRTIMTTQPKFVPNEAVSIQLDGKIELRIRMVDCVGYLVEGAMGHTENDEPRMVRTPWFDYDIPFEQAAEIGTQRVIQDHSAIGVVVTTDGTISDIPRENYVKSEERVVRELQELGKPFVIVLNSQDPSSDYAKGLAATLQSKYKTAVLLADVMHFSKDDVSQLFTDLLYEFPIKQVNMNVSGWVCALDRDHWLLSDVLAHIADGAEKMNVMRDYSIMTEQFAGADYIKRLGIEKIDLSDGTMDIAVEMKDELFYKVLGEECGVEIKNDSHLVSIVKEFVSAKTEYDRIAGAIQDVKRTGYGIVPPLMDELSLEEPEMVEQGNKFGVKLKASAPSLHLGRSKMM